MWGLGDAIFSGTVPLVSQYSFIFTLELSHSKRIFYPPSLLPESVSTAPFPEKGLPLYSQLQVQDIWGILGLVGHWGGPEVPQGCRHGSCDCAARLQVWHDQSHCDLIPHVWHDVLDCNLIPQVFRQNTLRGGVPTAERRNRCFKKLWQGSERGAPWKVEIMLDWYDVGLNWHVSKHFLTILFY